MPEPDFLKDEARKWRGGKLREIVDAATDAYEADDHYSYGVFYNGAMIGSVNIPPELVPEWFKGLPGIPG